MQIAYQNQGEALLTHAVRTNFGPPDYHLMNHVTLLMQDGTTQVDHILVSRFGVFVIETKHYTGWILGQPHDDYWTQAIYRKKSRFRNPLNFRQRFGRLCGTGFLFGAHLSCRNNLGGQFILGELGKYLSMFAPPNTR